MDDGKTIPDSWERLEGDARKAPREYIEGRGITSERRAGHCDGPGHRSQSQGVGGCPK